MWKKCFKPEMLPLPSWKERVGPGTLLFCGTCTDQEADTANNVVPTAPKKGDLFLQPLE